MTTEEFKTFTNEQKAMMLYMSNKIDNNDRQKISELVIRYFLNKFKEISRSKKNNQKEANKSWLVNFILGNENLKKLFMTEVDKLNDPAKKSIINEFEDEDFLYYFKKGLINRINRVDELGLNNKKKILFMIKYLQLNPASGLLILNKGKRDMSFDKKTYYAIKKKYNEIISNSQFNNTKKINDITSRCYVQYSSITDKQIRRYLDLIMIQTILNYYYNDIKIGQSNELKESVIDWILTYPTYNHNKSMYKLIDNYKKDLEPFEKFMKDFEAKKDELKIIRNKQIMTNQLKMKKNRLAEQQKQEKDLYNQWIKMTNNNRQKFFDKHHNIIISEIEKVIDYLNKSKTILYKNNSLALLTGNNNKIEKINELIDKEITLYENIIGALSYKKNNVTSLNTEYNLNNLNNYQFAS